MTGTDALLDTLLDAAGLSELLGRDVVARSARVKPGAQVTLGLEDPAGGTAGWVRVLWPALRPKAAKVAERAARRGQPLTERPLGDLLLQSGTVGSDPALANGVRALRPRRLRDLVDRPDAVLRYNPLRRVLVRDGATVVRLAAEPDALRHRLLTRLAGVGLPVPAPLDDGSVPDVSVRPFFGDADLLRTPSPEGMAWAGRTLADLHARGTRLLDEPELAALHHRPATADPHRLAHDLARLDADLGRRTTELADALGARPAPGGAPVLLHGDASADQVLVDTATGRRLLNDFDRAAVGPAALDLGSWLAVGDGGPLDAAFLAGYAEAGGALPSASDRVTARATGLFSRVMAPLRDADPDWRAGIAARLDRLAEVLR